MTTLTNILSISTHDAHAMQSGVRMHSRLRQIVISHDDCMGDSDLIERIKSTPGLLRHFSPSARTEVPIAGTINGRFISRRIDRLNIDDANKTIFILDYKTDLAPAKNHSDYVIQIGEYASLLHAIYPEYKIQGYILWTHDFSLENIPIKPL